MSQQFLISHEFQPLPVPRGLKRFVSARAEDAHVTRSHTLSREQNANERTGRCACAHLQFNAAIAKVFSIIGDILARTVKTPARSADICRQFVSARTRRVTLRFATRFVFREHERRAGRG